MPKKHVHKYQRGVIGKNHEIYKCMLPDCYHYLASPLVEGKRSICHRCGEEFIMSKKSLLLVKPHCIRCTKGSEQKEDLSDLVGSVLGKFGIK